MARLILIFSLLFTLTICYAGHYREEIEVKGFREEIVDFFSDTFSSELSVFFLSMLPVFELRLSIPLGIHYFGLHPLKVFLISLAGNMVPVFFILLFLDWLTKIFYKFPITKKIIDYIFSRTRKRTGVVEAYEELGLILFVSIPLPVTGAWTGSIASCIFGFSYWKSLLFIFLGVFIAGIIVLSLSLLGKIGIFIAFFLILIIFMYKIFDRRVKNG